MERRPLGGLEAFRVRALAGLDDVRDWVAGRRIIAAGLTLAVFTTIGVLAVLTRATSDNPIEDSLPVAVAIDPARVDPGQASTSPLPVSSGQFGAASNRDDSRLDEPPGIVVVHVAGAVAAPGVYRLAPDQRVEDVVVMAGGFLAEADSERLNLAAPVVDGTRIYVPERGDLISPTPVATIGSVGELSVAGSASPQQAVDVNSANLGDLIELPGVGPATASAIIEHREQRGPFTSTRDLLDVSGIGPAKLAAMSDRIVVR